MVWLGIYSLARAMCALGDFRLDSDQHAVPYLVWRGSWTAFCSATFAAVLV